MPDTTGTNYPIYKTVPQASFNPEKFIASFDSDEGGLEDLEAIQQEYFLYMKSGHVKTDINDLFNSAGKERPTKEQEDECFELLNEDASREGGPLGPKAVIQTYIATL